MAGRPDFEQKVLAAPRVEFKTLESNPSEDAPAGGMVPDDQVQVRPPSENYIGELRTVRFDVTGIAGSTGSHILSITTYNYAYLLEATFDGTADIDLQTWGFETAPATLDRGPSDWDNWPGFVRGFPFSYDEFLLINYGNYTDTVQTAQRHIMVEYTLREIYPG